MQFFVIAALAASALAVPAEIAPRHCNGGALYSVSQCCSTNVLNVAALDCQAGKHTLIPSAKLRL